MQDPQATYTQQQKELAAGAKAANLLEQYYLGAIVNSGIETVKGTGDLVRKSKVIAIAKKTTGLLSHIIIKSPQYSFILNYGFEGIKSNGVAMKLKAYNHIATAVSSGNIVDTLANEISDIRAEQVISSIKF
jgi:hypothetical protein